MKPVMLLLSIVALLLLAVDAQGSEEGIMKPDFGLMIWTWVSFIVLLCILGRYAYKPMMFLVEQREKRIRESLKKAEEAQKKAEAAASERAAILKEAQDEARAVIDRSREAGEAQRKRIVDDSREEAARIIKQAEEEIRRERHRAMAELTETVADLATEAAERIIGLELDQDKHLRIVDDLIRELEEKEVG